MAKMVDLDGREVTVVARKRLTDEDILLNRDVLMYSRVCEGHRVVEVAREFRLDRRYAYRRIKRIPPKAKDYIRKRVSEFTKDGICLLSEDTVESAKKLIRRERRKSDGLG